MEAANLAYLEHLYAEYLRNQNAVPESWQRYFAHGPIVAPAVGHAAVEPTPAALQERLDMLVRNYRVRGHIVANLDPLGRKRPEPPELDVSSYGFTGEDMDRAVFFAGRPLPLRDVIQRLRNTYCRSIGVQFMHIDDLSVRAMAAGADGSDREPPASSRREEQMRILTRLTDAVDLRGVHPEEIHRRQELFARRRRKPDSAARPGDRKGGRAGRRRDRAGHGPSRPAERAGQHHGQEPAADLPRVRRHRSRAAHRAAAT